MKWLKNVIKNALIEFLKETDLQLVERSTEHFVLSPDFVNVITVDCGQMPSGKATEYLERLAKQFKEWHPEYKIILMRKSRYN